MRNIIKLLIIFISFNLILTELTETTGSPADSTVVLNTTVAQDTEKREFLVQTSNKSQRNNTITKNQVQNSVKSKKKQEQTELVGIIKPLRFNKNSQNLLQNATEKQLDEVFELAHIQLSKEFSNLVTLKSKPKFQNRSTIDSIEIMNIAGNKESYRMNKYSAIALRASKLLRDKDLPLSGKIPSSFCPKVSVSCQPSKYRTYDGSCNNLVNPELGISGSTFKRHLPAKYDDGLNSPRRKSSIRGQLLPSAKLIADLVHTKQQDKSLFTQLFVYFGQFISHDLSSVASTTDRLGNKKECQCETSDPDCFNIDAPQESPISQTTPCLSFTRSAGGLDTFKCELGPREQINLATHWFDLSNVYGSNIEENLAVRGSNGHLRSSVVPNCRFEHLPFVSRGKCDLDPKQRCYLAPDNRVEQTNMMTAWHTIPLRLHNKLASQLTALNPHWDSDVLFEESRRLVIAIVQNIFYNEYAPLLIGETTASFYKLRPLQSGYLNQYDPKINPQVSNDFMAAAYRLHYLIYNEFSLTDSNMNPIDKISLNDLSFNPGFFYAESDNIYAGLVVGQGQIPSPHIADDLNHDLFGSGHSLAAINIQRGRDHGLSSYIDYRRLCGLSVPRSFKELIDIPEDVRIRLSEVYLTVADIDPFTGMASEAPFADSILGPTATCLTAKQFFESKYGDRFFYEQGVDPVTRFTSDQLNEIRKITAAKLLCSFTEIENIQANAFLVPSDANPILNCRDIPGLSVLPWAETFSK